MTESEYPDGWNKAAVIAAELIEALETDFKDEEEIKIGHVMVIVEVTGKDDDENWTSINYRCDSPKFWIQMGMLRAALRTEPDDLRP